MPKIKAQKTPMQKVIMVVDDEADIRETVKTVLSQEGYQVSTAVNGDDCLAQLKRGAKPIIILMDIMMPGTPVKEVVKKIKGIKIAYMSVVRVSDAEKEQLIGENVVDFIQKPFDINELIRKVKKLAS